MNLKAYYQKLRQTEASLTNPDVVLISLATPNGGRAGVPTEVPRDIAAKCRAGWTVSGTVGRRGAKWYLLEVWNVYP